MIIVCPHCGVVFDIETSNIWTDFANDSVNKKRHSYVAKCPRGCFLTQDAVDIAHKIKGVNE